MSSVKKPAKKSKTSKKSVKPVKKSVSKKKPKSTGKKNKPVKSAVAKISGKKKKTLSSGFDDRDRITGNDESDDVDTLTAAEIDEELAAYERQKMKATPKASKPRVEETPTLKLAKQISQFLFEKKAEDVVLANLDGLTSVTDYFVICTCTSDLHSRAVADHVVDELAKTGIYPHHKEGYNSMKWILIDFVDVIVHVFQKEAREYYDLERLWGDAKFMRMRDEALVKN